MHRGRGEVMYYPIFHVQMHVSANEYEDVIARNLTHKQEKRMQVRLSTRIRNKSMHLLSAISCSEKSFLQVDYQIVVKSKRACRLVIALQVVLRRILASVFSSA